MDATRLRSGCLPAAALAWQATEEGSVSVVHDWRSGPYTVDDLDDPVRFPPDEGTYEMRHGWVFLSARHDLNHEIIIDNAKAALRAAAARAGIKVRVLTPRVATPDGIRNSRIPDIAVVDAEALATDVRAARKYLTGGVLIAIEVVSPDRAAEDHIAKVADYSRAGIEWYWLIDTDPDLTRTVLRLVGTTYVEHATAHAGETLSVSEPLSVQIDVSSLGDR
jgi:Uma2 family endonuclease